MNSNTESLVFPGLQSMVTNSFAKQSESHLLSRFWQSQINNDDQVLLEWKDINFYVPEKKTWRQRSIRKSATIEQRKKIPYIRQQSDHSLSKELVTDHEEEPQVMYSGMKQILRNCSGFVQPGEIMAILGPSGSGKTSLLNLLSSRNKLSKNSKFSGRIEANGRTLGKNEFGKIGAFVQQDDVLLMTFTPLELFRFAARLRTSFGPEQIEEIVENVIRRLRLESCKNTLVGGIFMKGLSGGERKRTSIGYELITNPNLLILDEPTSGLDSHTALSIVKLLKSEARRGMTIVTTIHSPSSDIFQQFDRILVLSDGYSVYNGPNKRIRDYFSELNIKLPKFTNPADFLIKLASDPALLNPEITIGILDAKQKTFNYDSSVSLSRKPTNHLRITLIGDQRRNSFWLEFRLVFMRTLVYILRNPRASYMLLGMSIYMGLLLSAVFNQVGSQNIIFEFEALSKNYQTMANWLGFSFFCSSNMMLSMAYSRVLQMPIMKPVYYREFKANMYGAHSYFLANWLAGTIATLFYPLTIALITFFLVEVEDQSAGNLFQFIGGLFLVAICGCSYGTFWGTLCDNLQQALMYQDFVFRFFSMGAGAFTNLENNAFAKFLSYISPVRYSTELIMRRILSKKQVSSWILWFYGYEYGDATCYGMLFAMVIIYFILAWITIAIKARYI